MSVTCVDFPSVSDSGKYEGVSKKYILTGNGDLKAEIITYGARIQKLFVPDKADGSVVDVMLGYDDLDSYMKDMGNHGAVVGRSANRIAGARFTIDGVEYKIPQNDGNNNLHTGNIAYQNKFWTGGILSKDDADKMIRDSGIEGLCDSEDKLSVGEAVLLSCDSADGECGFPGNLKTWVLYAFLKDDTFLVVYKALSDKKTVFAPTQHAYFNLSGHNHGPVVNQMLVIDADKVTYKNDGCPDGTYIDVEGTPFDFRSEAPVMQSLDLTNPQIGANKGIDQNFCLKNEGKYKLVSVLKDNDSSRKMEVWTDMPGIQMYAGNHLDGDGYKDNSAYVQYGALCLEAQMYPNAVNVDEFDSPLIDAGETHYHACGYRFI